MTLLRQVARGTGARDTGRRAATARAAAALGLVMLAALIPLLGPSGALHGTGEAAAPGVRWTGLLRTVLFAAVCVPVGEAFVNRLAARLPGAPVPPPRSWSGYTAAAGWLASAGLAAVVATGNLLPHGLGRIDVGGLYRTRDGVLALLEVNGFLAAGLCAFSRRPSIQVWPLAVVILAEALRAHPVTESSALAGSALTLVHLACAALWAGGLLHVVRTLRVRRGHEGAALLGRFARAAALLLAAITATGVCSTLRRMPADTVLDQLTTTAYGRALLAKVILVAGVGALAAWARLRLRRATDPLSALVPARTEVALLGLVIAVSGLLTALPLPIRW
jgi:putative copper export protein